MFSGQRFKGQGQIAGLCVNGVCSIFKDPLLDSY